MRKLRWRNHFNGVCKKNMIAKKCCGSWPSSHQWATCPKIHCWRWLKHRHSASQSELSNVSRGSKFEKSDRHRNWIEVETAFYHFGWKGWRNSTPWMTAWLTWLSAVYTGASGHRTRRRNNGLYLSKQANGPRNALVSNAERWEGIQNKNYSLFYCPLCETLMLWTLRVG